MAPLVSRSWNVGEDVRRRCGFSTLAMPNVDDQPYEVTAASQVARNRGVGSEKPNEEETDLIIFDFIRTLPRWKVAFGKKKNELVAAAMFTAEAMQGGAFYRAEEPASFINWDEPSWWSSSCYVCVAVHSMVPLSGSRGSWPHRPEMLFTVSAKHGRDRGEIVGNSWFSARQARVVYTISATNGRE
ncbi:hypothetical protein Scep_007300 [Stephania cephalantha]|uniref:Uncharacterized protein n=1 Tax=Stephania cephalantha TaxID=152367 RepID=A0AAP0K9I6_9MAGN